MADSKISALKFKKYFDEFEMVRAEVLISGPDDREGNDDIYEANKQPVVEFWKKMMDKYGTEKEYNKQLINSFKHADYPEIIIVVDKLLVGFDAQRNAVLYVYKSLKEHTLLQAIARVNRLSEGKDYGYIIDYYGVLGKLDEAFDLYRNLSDFDKEDLVHALEDITEYANKLRQKHSDLKEIFKGIKNKLDEEEYEQLLADKALRDKFGDRLSDFARTLQLALSTASFLESTPEEKIKAYKDDLKFFMNLRTSVRRRYADEIDFKEFEPKIQKLLNSHLGAGEVESLTPLTNIFNEQEFKQEVEKQRSTASKADTIAHRTKRTLSDDFIIELPPQVIEFDSPAYEQVSVPLTKASTLVGLDPDDPLSGAPEFLMGGLGDLSSMISVTLPSGSILASALQTQDALPVLTLIKPDGDMSRFGTINLESITIENMDFAVENASIVNMLFDGEKVVLFMRAAGRAQDESARVFDLMVKTEIYGPFTSASVDEMSLHE